MLHSITTHTVEAMEAEAAYPPATYAPPAVPPAAPPSEPSAERTAGVAGRHAEAEVDASSRPMAADEERGEGGEGGEGGESAGGEGGEGGAAGAAGGWLTSASGAPLLVRVGVGVGVRLRLRLRVS